MMASLIEGDFKDFQLELLKSQAQDKDQRDLARKCVIFTSKEDGQWEDDVVQIFQDAGRPRLTMDRTSPMIDMMVGELEHSQFGPRVVADGKDADKKLAELRNGIIRAIMNRSDCDFTFKRIVRKLIHAGFDAIRVRHDYVDEESMDQDLMVEYIPNSLDRVFFDPNSVEQDRSDAEWAVVLQNVSKATFKEMFGENAAIPSSVDNGRSTTSYENTPDDLIMIGELYCIKYETKEIVQMSNGKIMEADEVDAYIAELTAQGMPVRKGKSRKVKKPEVYSRFFSGTDWLDDEKETAFTMLPVIPFYHCFDIIEDKVVWKRIVGKAMDAQRALNYAESQLLSKTALSPSEKIGMAIQQLDGVEDAMEDLNINIDPLFAYNHVDGIPAPYKLATNQVDQALMIVAQNAAANIEAIFGMYGASLAKNPQMQSGVAINKQIERGEVGNTGVWVDIAKGVTRLCQVLNNAIARTADTERSIQALYEDGTTEYVDVNKEEYDKESKTFKKKNDLTQGRYSVTCRMGPMYTTQKGETREALKELYVVPGMESLAPMTADIYTSTIDAPGMDQVHERLRMQMIAAGMIPSNQFTEEEKEAVAQAEAAMAEQQAQQPQETDPYQQLLAGQLSVDQFNAQVDARNESMKADAEVRLKEAQTRKELAEAEAQELENDIVENGINDLLGMANG